MNELHLTPVQLDALLLGDTSPAAASHLAVCPVCTAELAATRSSIGHLREALTGLAREERFRRNTQPTLLNFRPASPRALWRVTTTLALAASLAIVAAVVPSFRTMPHPPVARVPVAAPASTVQSDEALLNEINEQLSASVPSALEPLADPTGSQTSTNPISNKKD